MKPIIALNINATTTPAVSTYKVEIALYPTTLSNAICMKIIGVNDNIFSMIEIMKAQRSIYLHFHNSGRNHFTSKGLSLLSIPLSAFTEITIFFQSFSNSFIPTSCCLAWGSKGSRYLIK